MINTTFIESAIDVAVAGVALAQSATTIKTRMLGLRTARGAMARAIDYVRSGTDFPGSKHWLKWAERQWAMIISWMDTPKKTMTDILIRHEQFTDSLRDVRTA